jgi:hypothetical protein
VPVIVFPPKVPTVLPPGTSSSTTTIFDSDDPEFRPGTSSGSTGTTGSGGSDDPTTTDGVSGVVLEPKVAVKTIPSALGLVVARGSDPSGGQPSGVEVAAAETDGSARVAAAPSADGSDEAAGPVATSRTGLTRRLSDSVSSPLGGLLIAALVSFVVAGSYCGWLLLARR